MAQWDDVRRIALGLPDGFPAVLVRLDEITAEDLEEVIVEAWLARAPKRLAKAYVDRHL